MKYLYLILGLVLGFSMIGYTAYAVSASPTDFGGTGTTSPSGLLYGDNGATKHLNTVTVGTGLTFSGGTLSSTGGTSFGQTWELGTDAFSVTALSPTTSVPIYVKTSTATSSFRGGIESWKAIGAPYLFATSTATSTFVGGVNINGTDCFAVAGTCLQTFIQNATAFKSAANYATAAILPGTPTYSNGVAGVGATLTEVGFGALVVDGQTVTLGQRILVKNQMDQTTNGVYTVTTVGSGLASYVLTRATDFNTSNDVYAGVTVPVLAGGTVNGDTVWTESTTGTIVIGTSNIVFIETSVGNSAALFAWPFTVSTQYGQTVSGTTSALYLTGSPISLMASSTSIFDLASSTAASTTRLTVGTQWFTGLSLAELAVNSSGKVYGAATTTAGTGLTYNGTNFSVNTSQNIAILSNLTNNGFVQTSGGVGTLGVQTFPCPVAQGCSNSTSFTGNRILYTDSAGTTFKGTASSTLFGDTSTGGFVVTWSNTANGLVLAATSSVAASGLTSYDAFTHTSSQNSATTSAIGIGTTTPWAMLSISTSTTAQPAAPLFAIASSSNAPIFSVLGSGNVGIGTTSPFAVFSLVGDLQQYGHYVHQGSVAPLFKCTGDSCEDFVGNDNTTSGVGIAAENINGGNSAYSYLTMNNDKQNAAVTRGVSGLQFNSSTYNDVTFGTLFAQKSAAYFFNLEGALYLNSSTSTPAANYIVMATGGSDATNERMRITNAGLVGIGTTTPWTTLGINTSAGTSSFAIGSSTGSYMVVDKIGNVMIGAPFATTSRLQLAVANTGVLNSGTGSLLLYVGDSVTTNSAAITYSSKPGSSSGASANLGFNSYIDVSGTSRVINPNANGWTWKIDNRDNSPADNSPMSFHMIQRNTTDVNIFQLQATGQINLSGTDPASVASCGSSPAFVGGNNSDTAGRVRVGTGSVAACTITFSTAFQDWPECYVNLGPKGGGATSTVITASTTLTTMIVNASASNMGGSFINYFCVSN